MLYRNLAEILGERIEQGLYRLATACPRCARSARSTASA